jgi:hypothetical protein
LVWIFMRKKKRPASEPQPPRHGEPEFAVTAGFMGRVATAYVAILIALAGAGMLGYQAVAWFEGGGWPNLSFSDAGRAIFGAVWPSASGLSLALEWLPFGAVLLLMALGCLAVVFRDTD